MYVADVVALPLVRMSSGRCGRGPRSGTLRVGGERGGHGLRRVIVALVTAVVTALAALLVLAPAASAASSESEASAVTAEIGGLEYAATDTEGRFGGAAHGEVPGAWLATVVHDPLTADSVPITGGSFVLHGTQQREIRGTFVDGTVTPLDDFSTCANQRFDVKGVLALDGGGSGSFAVVLTHLLTQTKSGWHISGALVRGSLTVPAGAVGGAEAGAEPASGDLGQGLAQILSQVFPGA